MTLDAHLERALRRELRLCRSTCEVLRLDPDSAVLDTDTGILSPATSTTVYSGPCQMRVLGSDRDQERSLGESMVELERHLVKVPVTVDVHRGDVVHIITSRDPGAVDRRFVVQKVEYTEWAVMRRLVCEEVAP